MLMRIVVVSAVLGWSLDAAVLSFPPQSDSTNEVKVTMNKDVRYDKWLNPAKVLYRFDENAYSGEEKTMIWKAMDQIAEDMNHCINFKEYNVDTDAGWDNIYISKTLNDGSVPPTCFSFYGRVLRAAGQGQKMAIHGGPTGCMESQRDVMKLLVNVLGLRNEYNRPDRDQFIKVFPENLEIELRNSNLLTAYNASQVDTIDRPFDYHSITIPCGKKYGMNNLTVIEFPEQKEYPTLDRLSVDDCLGLSAMYGCDAKKCQDPYKDSQVPIKELPQEDKILVELNPNATQASTTIIPESTTVLATESTTILATQATVLQSTEATTVIIPASSAADLIVPTSTELASSASSAIPSVPSTLETTVATTVAAVTEAQTSTETHHEVETSATILVTLATTATPLNISLTDIVNLRKGDVAETTTAAAAVTAAVSTEGPIVIVTEAPQLVTSQQTVLPESTTVAVLNETTTQSAQLKLVFVANQSEVNNTANHVEIPQKLLNESLVDTTTIAVTDTTTSVATTVASTTLLAEIVSTTTVAPLPTNASIVVTASEQTISGNAPQPVVNVSLLTGNQVQDLLAMNATTVAADVTTTTVLSTIASNSTAASVVNVTEMVTQVPLNISAVVL